MKVREVPVGDLRSLEGADWVDRKKRPYIEGGTAYVPVTEGFFSTTTIPPRRIYQGRGYSMMGDVAVFHGRRPDDEEVRALIEWRRPAGVLWVQSCEGVTRTPRTEVLAGAVHEVRHRECGITYFLDPSRIMFAVGNRTEKERISALTRPGERVADMYAGIGYFTLPAALAGARVHAMEIHPLAFSYLEQNIRENGVSRQVTADLGDCRDYLNGTYDRILMGHFSSLDRLSDALAHAGPGTVLHVHSAGAGKDAISRFLEEREVNARVETHRVKKLAPHTWHYVQDVTLE
ncbi:MAG: SAM-dependent methyltransferase [Methanolinea sp.]|nr:SAM-dependent methyltransferase [Methanolinea sp.]